VADTATTDAAARIKKSTTSNQIKFKIRCNRFLYTLILKDSEKADKIKQSLPPGMSLPTLYAFPGGGGVKSFA